jgi:hypothetical protein
MRDYQPRIRGSLSEEQLYRIDRALRGLFFVVLLSPFAWAIGMGLGEAAHWLAITLGWVS